MRAVQMNGRSAALNLILVSCIVLSSCATQNLAKNNLSVSAFCENKRAKSQYVFVLASYNGVPKGTPIEKVNALVNSSTRTTNFVKDHFIQALLVNYYTDSIQPTGSNLNRNESLYDLFQQEFRRDMAVLQHLVWVKDNRFATCEYARCYGKPFPGFPNDLIDFDGQNWSDGRCFGFFHDDGYIGGLGCRGNAFGSVSYMKHSGFNAGWLLANTYLSTPESQKNKLCTEAGLSSDCFNIFTSMENYVKFRGQLANDLDVKAQYPFFNSIPGYPDSWSASDKLLAESAYSKDLALKAGTKITTKIQNEWTVYRITWDPTLFCKYGRPNEEFYTQ